MAIVYNLLIWLIYWRFMIYYVPTKILHCQQKMLDEFENNFLKTYTYLIGKPKRFLI